MSLKNISDVLIAKYKESIKNNHPFIVGIDGLGGAGKTTITTKLKESLKTIGMNVMTIHLDEHIVVSDKRYKTEFEEWYEYYFLQWDINLLQTELFQALSSGARIIELPFYDKANDKISLKNIEITHPSIVLVEGIFIQRHEWREYLDIIIFVDCPDKEREERVLDRDQYIGDYQKRLAKYKRRYWPAEEYYIKVENPKANADIIYS
ncbi:kinase [Oceanobacillus sp. CAU 1775]